MSFTLPVTLSSEGITSKLFFFPSEVSNKVKISTQPYITLCVQFLDRENNDKKNTQLNVVCHLWEWLAFNFSTQYHPLITH